MWFTIKFKTPRTRPYSKRFNDALDYADTDMLPDINRKRRVKEDSPIKTIWRKMNV